ncbi:MAG TPA: extensin family protein [Polyangiales bacterium]|nr:extensin family protein [Polyangiales bacterium]
MSNDNSARKLRVSTWKSVQLVVVGVLFVASCVYALIWRASPDLLARSPRATLPHMPAVAPHSPRAAGSEAACYEGLSARGVTFQTVPKSEAPGVAWPIKLTSAVDGVLIHGVKSDAPTNYLDCRLALALLAWAPSLRERGVVGLEHYSAYRRDAVVAGTTSPSGHAIGSAIDVGLFEMRDGRKLSVLEDWTNRARGKDPCQEFPTDDEAARTMRKLVCDAYQHELFQRVITPHYNDAHKNHVHLEVAPKSEGAWIG